MVDIDCVRPARPLQKHRGQRLPCFEVPAGLHHGLHTWQGRKLGTLEALRASDEAMPAHGAGFDRWRDSLRTSLLNAFGFERGCAMHALGVNAANPQEGLCRTAG